MYTLTRTLSIQTWVTEKVPGLAISLVLAEYLYKFHSFTLECLAFLATWYAIDFVIYRLRRGVSTRQK